MVGAGMSGAVTPMPDHAQPADGASEVIGDGRSARSTLLEAMTRVRGWIVLGVLVCVTVVIGVMTAGTGGQVPLSPDNPAPNGSRATAEVLGRSGVDVIHTESIGNTIEALQGPDDTLLLHDPNGWLSAEQLQELGAGLADRIVLVEPGLAVLSELTDGIRSAGLVPADVEHPLEADCSNPDAAAAAATSATGRSYRGAVTCFPIPQQGNAPPAGTFVTSTDGRVVVIGGGAILSNDLVDEHGNAALALRTLGSTPTLVWYQPTPEDLAAGANSVDPLTLLPEFVNPLMIWLLVTALLAILWRGRRLGPLVTEPLPVVVRSAETAAGRARLYQDAGAVNHAAETLRAGTLMRLAAALRIPVTSPRTAVVAAAAHITHREYAELDRLLNTHTPRSDAELVQWSQELEKLEQEIRLP